MEVGTLLFFQVIWLTTWTDIYGDSHLRSLHGNSIFETSFLTSRCSYTTNWKMVHHLFLKLSRSQCSGTNRWPEGISNSPATGTFKRSFRRIYTASQVVFFSSPWFPVGPSMPGNPGGPGTPLEPGTPGNPGLPLSPWSPGISRPGGPG